jgi:transposase-like protein
MKNNNESRVRRQLSADAKWHVPRLKEGRSTNLTISQVCDQHQISPTLFYQWERTVERGARQALHGQPRGHKKLRPTEEALLEVQRLREVIAEITSENLRLKGAGK